MAVYLLKPGELTLKGGNRPFFEKSLLKNLSLALKGSEARCLRTGGRFFVLCEEAARDTVEDALSHLSGITGWAAARACEKSRTAVLAACLEEARESERTGGVRTFKLEARRTDKSFPLSSYEICREAGAEIVRECGLTVDVHKPDLIIRVEIREKAYIYGREHRGLRGLPAGTSGRGLLLLSGGIDSPVAGYLMAVRGMTVHAVYFHAYPYTSDEARQKVIRLSEIVARFAPGLKLYVLNFTDVQLRIKDRGPPPWATVLLRMAMMETASILALREKCRCLITGESLAQVASQTIENIACSQSRSSFPVLRPLIGMDKEDIIRRAVEIGTYKTSILPYADCCELFSPEHPVIKGDAAEAQKFYDALDLAEIISGVISNHETYEC